MKTIGEWYRDNVLHRDDLIEVELPYSSGGQPRIEAEIFCWRLYHGKKYIECETELRARYLKAFMDARVNRIRLPQDEEYLRVIVPKLEKHIAAITEILDDRTCGILNETRKQKLLDLTWYKLMREGYEEEEKLFPYVYEEPEDDEDDDDENVKNDEEEEEIEKE